MKLIIGSFFLIVPLAIACLVGWVMNIIALVGILSGPITAMFVARIVGIPVPPLGAVLGLFF